MFFPDINDTDNVANYYIDFDTWEHLQIPNRFVNETLSAAFYRAHADIHESGVFEYPIEPEVLNDFDSFYCSPYVTGYRNIGMSKVITLNKHIHSGELLSDFITYITLDNVRGWLFMERNNVFSVIKNIGFTIETGFTKDNFLKDKLYTFLSLLTIDNNRTNICALPTGMTYSEYSNLW